MVTGLTGRAARPGSPARAKFFSPLAETFSVCFLLPNWRVKNDNGFSTSQCNIRAAISRKKYLRKSQKAVRKVGYLKLLNISDFLLARPFSAPGRADGPPATPKTAKQGARYHPCPEAK